MMDPIAIPAYISFATHESARTRIEELCSQHRDIARFEVIGYSEQDREMYGVVLGRGARHVSLVAGAHADEPVGPQTLRHFVVSVLERREQMRDLLERYTFVIVPHVNPDGEAANWAWIERWPDPLAYVRHVVREPPGRDIEFGYPAMRAENRAVAAFLRGHAPFELHMSLHGMAVADGAWLLIEKHWIDRTPELRRKWIEAVRAAGLRLFDWDRKGDKGFIYIGPGFATTPEGAAMRAHFEAEGDPQTASLFHQSSMEYVRSLSPAPATPGSSPLCLVTELPLFVLTRQVAPSEPGQPTTYLKFKEALPQLRLMIERDDLMGALRLIEPFGVEPLDLATGMRLQLRALELGLETVT